MNSAIARLLRQGDFARHVPPRQILHRFWLSGRRRIERRLRPKLLAADLVRTAQPPLPLFPPRTGMVVSDAPPWSFRFIGNPRWVGNRSID